MQVLRGAVVAFNDYHVSELRDLRVPLITSVPALQRRALLR
jgi:hypothetical protein